eukprot:TRINITY_DN32424_c0_g2_i1.p1 TRINITY_DN32424_c0_g2~~TRINITY_DN32424_c0_g2_i1.p1  ORF type:complete len:293 (+),score=2.69 TRINITY_DN32424_c0_g2_i1:74-880(+)
MVILGTKRKQSWSTFENFTPFLLSLESFLQHKHCIHTLSLHFPDLVYHRLFHYGSDFQWIAAKTVADKLSSGNLFPVMLQKLHLRLFSRLADFFVRVKWNALFERLTNLQVLSLDLEGNEQIAANSGFVVSTTAREVSLSLANTGLCDNTLVTFSERLGLTLPNVTRLTLDIRVTEPGLEVDSIKSLISKLVATIPGLSHLELTVSEVLYHNKESMIAHFHTTTTKATLVLKHWQQTQHMQLACILASHLSSKMGVGSRGPRDTNEST